MNLKKINFKHPKYIYPLIVLPFALFLIYRFEKMSENVQNDDVPVQELSVSLGEVSDSILSKNDAYDRLFQNPDSRTMLEGLDEEEDTLFYYTDNLDDLQKRYIDSLRIARENQQSQLRRGIDRGYYDYRNEYERDYQRSAELLELLNNESRNNPGNFNRSEPVQDNPNTYKEEDEYNEDPIKMMREQMLLLDSLDRARDPELQKELAAQERLKKNEEKYKAFMNSTLKVDKLNSNPAFNTIYKNNQTQYIKAVIDENIKGYLGSRIRIRLLEDVYIEQSKIAKGTVLYATISGFDLQRVHLNIVSILHNNEILPINLTIFDIDGIKGLYVPQSDFREMMRELGINSVQGSSLDMTNQNFYTSMFSNLFSSGSQMISKIIRKNKAKLKYNSHIYLINEKQLNSYNN